MAGCLVRARILHAARSRTGTSAGEAGTPGLASAATSLSVFFSFFSSATCVAYWGRGDWASTWPGSARAVPTHAPASKEATVLHPEREPNMESILMVAWRPADGAGLRSLASARVTGKVNARQAKEVTGAGRAATRAGCAARGSRQKRPDEVN